jgi:hypothetical protein
MPLRPLIDPAGKEDGIGVGRSYLVSGQDEGTLFYIHLLSSNLPHKEAGA